MGVHRARCAEKQATMYQAGTPPTPGQQARQARHTGRVIPRVARHVRPTLSNRSFDGQLAGERVVWIRRRSPLPLLLTALPILVGVAILSLFVSALAGAGGVAPLVQALGALPIVVYTAWWGTTRLPSWFFEYYVLTDQRVIKTVGYFHRRREEIGVKSIAQVRVEQGNVLSVLFGLGAVEVRPVGSPILLAGIAHPRDVADSILAIMEGGGLPAQASAAAAPRVPLKRLQATLDRLAKPTPLPGVPQQRRSFFEGLVHRKIPIRFIEDEALVAVVYRHWFVLLRSETLALAFVAGGLLLWAATRFVDATSMAPELALVGGVVAGLVVGYVIFLNWADDVFVLTTHRVIDIDRLFFLLAEYSNDAPYGRIQNIHVERTLLGKALGFGSIVVETSGRKYPLRMTDIPHAFTVMDRIFEQMRLVREREATAALNKQKKEHYLWQATVLNELLVRVPVIRGLPLPNALDAARRARLRLVVEQTQAVPGAPPNRVLYQSPQDGSSTLINSEIRVIVSEQARPRPRRQPVAPRHP